MTRRVFVREGREYRAWIPATSRRKMDLSDERIASREANARSFLPGWDERLRHSGHLLRIHDPEEGCDIWFVDTRSGAKELGCTPRSLEKNLEIMRRLRALPPNLNRLAVKYGFDVQRSRDDYNSEESVAATPTSPLVAASPRSVPQSAACSPQESTPCDAPRVTTSAATPAEPVTGATTDQQRSAQNGSTTATGTATASASAAEEDEAADMDVDPPVNTPAAQYDMPTVPVASPVRDALFIQMDTPCGTAMEDVPAPARTPEFQDRTRIPGLDDDEYVQMMAQCSRIL